MSLVISILGSNLIIYILKLIMNSFIKEESLKNIFTTDEFIRILVIIYCLFIFFYKEKYINIIDKINIFLFTWLSFNILIFLINLYSEGIEKIILIVFFIIFVSIMYWNKYGIYLSQFILPLYLFKILENKYYYKQELINFESNLVLKIFIITLVLILLGFNIYEISKKKQKILLSTVFIIGIIVFWKNIPMIYNLDEYHYGEVYTAFDQIFNKGNKIYSEYIPVKGYSHIIIGWINDIFYGGYIGIGKSLILTDALVRSIIITIMGLILNREICILLILANIFPENNQYLFLIPVFLLLNYKKIFQDDWNYIITCSFMVFLSFMYYQAFGIAFGIAIFPSFLYRCYIIVKNKIKIKKRQLLILVLEFILIIYNFSSIINGIKYSLLNASSNLLYWGNISSHILEKSKFIFLIEVVFTNIWVLILIYFVLELKKFKIETIVNNKILETIIIIYSLAIFTYLVGRHDSLYMRSFYYSIFLSQILLIKNLYEISKLEIYNLKKGVILIFLFGYCIVGKGIIESIKNNKSLYSDNFITISKNIINKIEDDYERGNRKILKLGNGFISKDRLEDLEKEYILIKECIKGSEKSSFLIIDNYTTQSARYSIFDLKIPTISHSVLNIPSLKGQEIELKRFNDFNVPIIRISEGINRYILFYKEILLRGYVYTKYNNREYLIEKEIFNQIKDKYKLESLQYPEYIYQKDFGVLPIKWGNGFLNNKEKIKKLNSFTIVKEKREVKNTINYKLNPTLKGSDIDFIRLRIDTKYTKLFKIKIEWVTESNNLKNRNNVVLDARKGDLVIPMIKNYNWLVSNKIEEIKIELLNFPVNEQIKIEKIEFYKYEVSNKK